jgi:hypothetical protein
LISIQRCDGRKQIVEELAAQPRALARVFRQRLVEQLRFEEVFFAGDRRNGVGLAGERLRGGTQFCGFSGEAMGAAKQTGDAERKEQAEA